MGRGAPFALAGGVRRLFALVAFDRARLQAFLDRYGHRAVAEIDVGVPRWAEDPSHVLGVLANYLRMTTSETTRSSPDALFADGAAEAEAIT